jgi:NAD(P) transhydrogenase subunit beta
MANFTLNIIDLGYVAAVVLFVMGLHFMNSPKTARKGNSLSAVGMTIAVVGALIASLINGFENSAVLIVLLAGIFIGAAIGVISAKKVEMTAMPQLVSLFNTVGGGAAALIALNDLLEYSNSFKTISGGHEPNIDYVQITTAVLGIVIGAVTFSGSLVAAGKLQGIVRKNIFTNFTKKLCDFIAIALIFFAAYSYYLSPESTIMPALMLLGGLILGLTFVFPIGGADMPVVISVLNAFTGTAVALTGFVLDNTIMIVAGALVGSAGSILSVLMAKAMNRTLISVLIGGFGDTSSSASAGDSEAVTGTTRSTTSSDLAVQLVYAQKVIFVPGYGLAAAHAQHEIADLTKLLEEKGVEVLFAIHPVAGRMPGHMNVLLAEANVPYEKLIDLDDINPQFDLADVAVVVGANDVTNPAARREGTPVSGMPILDVDHAKNIVVIKRGSGAGYAGIENELYFDSKTKMLYGDAKKMLTETIAEVKEL